MEDAMVTLFYSFFQFCQRRSDYDDAQERKLQALDFFFFFWVFAMVNSKGISLSKAKLMCSPNISGGVSGG